MRIGFALCVPSLHYMQVTFTNLVAHRGTFDPNSFHFVTKNVPRVKMISTTQYGSPLVLGQILQNQIHFSDYSARKLNLGKKTRNALLKNGVEPVFVSTKSYADNLITELLDNQLVLNKRVLLVLGMLQGKEKGKGEGEGS